MSSGLSCDECSDCRHSEPAPRPLGASDASGGCAVALFYWPGPDTVKLTELDSFLPSAVQMAPSALQSVVAGSSIVTSPLPFGSTVISHQMLLGLSIRCALRTSPPVSVNAKSLRVL